MSFEPSSAESPPVGLPPADHWREIAAALRGLRFGSVHIVVQDGVVIQIERTEKKRLRSRREQAGPATSER